MDGYSFNKDMGMKSTEDDFEGMTVITDQPIMNLLHRNSLKRFSKKAVSAIIIIIIIYF